MAPKNKINLKDKLEDGELDLSMSDLQEVPVRDIAVLKKATSLDLSNNRLTSLGKNFISLTQIVKLDLSKNLLKELPEDFGEMSQLKHLDLYSNQLKHLPLSFYKLKSLRWLDLKNNPLVPAVAKVAGQCLDSTQCVQCAKDVVIFFTQMKEQIEEETARREEQRQVELEAEALHQRQQQKKKDRKKAMKAKKNKAKADKVSDATEFIQDVYPEYPVINTAPVSSAKKAKTPAAKAKSCSCLKFFMTLFFFLGISSLVYSTMKTDNAVLFKQKAIDLWTQSVEKVPENYRPWALQLGDSISKLHAMTDRGVENIMKYVDELKQNENVSNYLNLAADIWKIFLTESRKILNVLSDKAVIITNEIKKKIV